ncbi:MAG TPA: aldo/keto reductase, partial [Actinoplanes sp.]|nr:aldo/keto reductase [Actinoplanes sp.]
VGGRPVSANQLAAMIHADPRSHGKQIVLISCDTGSTLDGYPADLTRAVDTARRNDPSYPGPPGPTRVVAPAKGAFVTSTGRPISTGTTFDATGRPMPNTADPGAWRTYTATPHGSDVTVENHGHDLPAHDAVGTPVGAPKATVDTAFDLAPHELRDTVAFPSQVPPFTPPGRETTNYTVQHGDTPPFTRTIPEPEVVDRGPDASPRYVVRRPTVSDDHPSLRVSPDATMAVNATPDGRKNEFYTTPQRIQELNGQLRRAGSAVTLTPVAENTLRLNDHPGAEPLVMVQPRFDRTLPSVCRDFAAGVIGGSPSHTVLRPNARTDPGTARAVPIVAHDGMEVTGVYHLAEQLATTARENRTNELTTTRARDIMARDTRNHGRMDGAPRPGRDYGMAMHQDPNMVRASRALGINQFARAQVGEAYMTQSVSDRGDGRDAAFDVDFSSEGAPVERAGAYGYHFAGVVAESADGRMHVTLENARPNSAVEDMADEALRQNVAHHLGDGGTPTTDPRYQAYFEELAPLVGDPQAFKQAAALARLQLLNDSPDIVHNEDLWHFRAWGDTPAQSHFASQQQSPKYVNPITMVVVGGHATRTATVDFGAGVTDVDPNTPALRSFVQAAAQVAAWRDAQGLQPPAIRVEGGANGRGLVRLLPDSMASGPSSHAGEIGQQRAESVKTALAQRLTAMNDPAGRIPIQTGSRGRQPAPGDGPSSQRRRSALVDLETSPPGSRAVRTPSVRSESSASSQSGQSSHSSRGDSRPGVSGPWAMFGTDGRSQSEIASALDSGFRRFDLAESYRNTDAAAAALSGPDAPPRGETEIVYKFDVQENESPEQLTDRIAAVADSFGGRLDSVLIHNIDGGSRAATERAWDVLANLQSDGRIDSIGLGNVRDQHLDQLTELHGRSPVGIVENSLDSLLRDSGLQDFVNQSAQRQDPPPAIYYYGVRRLATDMGLHGPADIRGLASAVTTFYGDAPTRMIVSSGNPARQTAARADFDLAPEHPDHDGVDQFDAQVKVFNWKQAPSFATTNGPEVALPPNLRQWLSDTVTNSEDVRSEVTSAAQAQNRPVNAEFVGDFLTDRGVIDSPAELDTVRVPERYGLRTQHVDRPLSDVLQDLLGNTSCDWKAAIELTQLTLTPVDDWNNLYPHFGEIVTTQAGTGSDIASQSDAHSAAPSHTSSWAPPTATDLSTHDTPPPPRQVDAGLMLLDDSETTNRAAAQSFSPREGQFMVFGHGTPQGVVVGGRLVTPEQLASMINADPRSHGRQIVLVSCDTGSSIDGFPAQLAQQPGITSVVAPTQTAWITSAGRPITAATTTFTTDGRPGPDTTNPGNWRRYTAAQQPETAQQEQKPDPVQVEQFDHELPSREAVGNDITPNNPIELTPDEQHGAVAFTPSKKDLLKQVDDVAHSFTKSYGAGQFGRAVDNFRLRFVRDKRHQRAAQTLSHASFQLHDTIRALRDAQLAQGSTDVAKDLEVQGMLVNNRLVFATNFNESIDLLANATPTGNPNDPPLRRLLDIQQSDAGRRRNLNGPDADEYAGRMRRTNVKIEAAFDGQRPSATANAMQANNAIRILDAAPTTAAGRQALRDMLTSSQHAGDVILLRHAGSGDNSMHAEQKLLLAMHSAGMTPADVRGTHLIMGKYRPCLGCWAALHHHEDSGFPVDFDRNFGNYYAESVRTLVNFLPHTLRDPLGRTSNYLASIIGTARNQMMSVAALSRQQVPPNAVDNGGPEVVIPASEAPNRGYVTASDSETEIKYFDRKRQYVTYKRNLDYASGSRARTLGTGTDKPFTPRAAHRILSDDEGDALRNVWERGTSEQIAQWFKHHASRGATYAEISEATGASAGHVGRIVNDKDGHESRDSREKINQRVQSRGGRRDSTAKSTTAGKFTKRSDLDSDGRRAMIKAMDRDFRSTWEAGGKLAARHIPGRLNDTLDALRRRYNMQSIADELRIPRKSLQQHLDKRYGSVNENATKTAAPTRQASPDDVEMHDAPASYYDDTLGRSFVIPPDTMDYQPTGPVAGPSRDTSSYRPGQVRSGSTNVSYTGKPQFGSLPDRQPPPAGARQIYVDRASGDPIYEDARGVQYYFDRASGRWQYYDEASNDWFDYNPNDPGGKGKNTRFDAPPTTETHDTAPTPTEVPAGLALLDDTETDNREAAGNFAPRADQYLVFGHGTPAGIVVGGKLVTPEQLASLINADTRSHGKQIVLISCDTGRAGFPAQLAQQPGIISVTAPTKAAWITSTGRTVSAGTTAFSADGRPQPDLANPGNWRRYTAGEPVQVEQFNQELPGPDTTGTELTAEELREAVAFARRPVEVPQTIPEHAELRIEPAAGPLPPAPTPLSVRRNLPGYLRESRSLGLAKQLGATENVDLRTPLTALSPDLDRATVERIQELAESGVAPFLGEGHPFPVTIDHQPAELVVRAVFDWHAVEVGEASAEPNRAAAKATSKDSRTATAAHDGSVAARAGFSAMPPFAADASVQAPAGPTETETAGRDSEFTQSSTVDVDNGVDTRLPVRFVLSLRTADGTPVGQRDGADPVAGATIALRVPKDLKGPVGLAWALESPPPTRFGVESATARPAGDRTFFQQVAALLPPEVTAIGARGRETLQQFLDDANIAAKLPTMVAHDGDAHPEAGWITSEPLLHGPRHGRTRLRKAHDSAVQMRLVPRLAQVTDQIDEATHTDSQSHTGEDKDANVASRTIGLNVMAGAGTEATPVKFIVGPRVAISQTREHGQEHSATTQSAETSTVTGPAGRYQVVYDLQVRAIGRPATRLNGTVESFQWATKDRVDRAGLTEGVTGGWHGRRGADRTHWAPRHVENGQSFGGALIDDFTGGDQLYEAVSRALRTVPGRRDYHLLSNAFLGQFDDPTLTGGLTAGVQALIARDTKARNALSDRQLSMLLDRIVGPGLTVPLVKNGHLHDYHTLVKVSGTVGALSDGDIVERGSFDTDTKLKEKSGTVAGHTRTSKQEMSIEGRVYGTLSRIFGTLAGGPKVSHTGTKSHALGVSQSGSSTHDHGGTLDADGAVANQRMREFLAPLTLTTSAESHRRLNTSGRRLTIGRPGRQAPTMLVPPAMPEQSHLLDVRLLIPEHRVSGTPPEPATGAERGRPPVPETTVRPDPISRLPGGYSRDLDGNRVESFTAAGELQAAVKETLMMASGDPIYGFSDGTISAAIADALSPENFRGELRLFSKPVVLDGLNYGRRVADVHGRAGVRLRPTNPRVLPSTEYERAKQSVAGGVSSKQSRGHEWELSATVTGSGALAGQSGLIGRLPANAAGVLMAQIQPLMRRWGRARGQELTSTSRLRLTGRPENRVLVRLDVDAEVVAETRSRGNIDRWDVVSDDTVHRAGQQLKLPDSVQMWMTEAQVHRLREFDLDRDHVDRDITLGRTQLQENAALVQRQQQQLRTLAGAQLRARTTADPAHLDDLGRLQRHALRNLRLDQGRERLALRTEHAAQIDRLTQQKHDELLALAAQKPREAQRANEPARAELQPPPVGPGGTPSLGLGGVSTPIDLTDRIPHLRRRLAASLGEAAAERLLPTSPLRTPHDNLRTAHDFLSDLNRHLPSGLNGGRSQPLRLEDRFSGKTYFLTAQARFPQDPRFAGIEHVEQLGTASKVVLTKTDTRTDHSTALGVTGNSRVNGALRQDPATVHGTEHGPASTTAGAGLRTGANLGVRDRKQVDTGKTTYKKAASVKGPTATWDGDVLIDLTISRGDSFDNQGGERGGTVVAADAQLRPVQLHTLAGDTLPDPVPGDGRLGLADPPTLLPRGQRTPQAMAAWRDAPGHPRLPEASQFNVEHVFADMADLRAAAARAITDSGRTVDASTIAALRDGLSPDNVRGALSAMLDGTFRLPLPGGADRILHVDARLVPRPRLAGADARVELSGSDSHDTDRKIENTTGNTYATGAVLPAVAAGVNHPDGARPNFGALAASTQREQALFESAPAQQRKAETTVGKDSATVQPSTAALADQDKLTRTLSYDIEFRFVASSRPKMFAPNGRHSGGTELRVHDAAILRVKDAAAEKLTGERLPDALRGTATTLADTSKAWSKAEAARDSLRARQDPAATADELAAADQAMTAAATAWWDAIGAHRREVRTAQGHAPTPAAPSTPRKRGVFAPPQPAPSRSRQELAAAVDEVAARTGNDLNACVSTMRRLAARLYPDGVRSARAVDDSVVSNAAVFAGIDPAAWQRAPSWDTIQQRLAAMGPASTAFVLMGRPGRIGHAFAAQQTTDAGAAWIDAQRRPGSRVIPAGGRPSTPQQWAAEGGD